MGATEDVVTRQRGGPRPSKNSRKPSTPTPAASPTAKKGHRSRSRITAVVFTSISSITHNTFHMIRSPPIAKHYAHPIPSLIFIANALFINCSLANNLVCFKNVSNPILSAFSALPR